MPTVPRAAARAIFRMEGLPLCSKLHVALRQRVTLSIGLPATSHAFLITTLFAPQKASQAARMRSSRPRSQSSSPNKTLAPAPATPSASRSGADGRSGRGTTGERVAIAFERLVPATGDDPSDVTGDKPDASAVV